MCVSSVTISTVQSKSKSTPTIRLNNGYNIPVLGLGTSRAEERECEEAVKNAIDAGYRHIDSAYVYGNEKEVGNAIRTKIDEGVIKREDIFITTKLWNTFHNPEDVSRAFQKSFDNLNLTYIDLYLPALAHRIYYKTQRRFKHTFKDIDEVDANPTSDDGKSITADIDYLDTWRAMEELMKDERIKVLVYRILIANKSIDYSQLRKIKPVTNQVECHPNFNQHKLHKFCADRNITLIAYSPLGRPHGGSSNLAINDPRVYAIAEAHNKSSAQVVLRYSYQCGAIAIPKSSNKERIKANIDIFDFELSEKDMQIMNELNTNNRLLTFSQAAHDKHYPFHLEF